jgi:hypothetical protein
MMMPVLGIVAVSPDPLPLVRFACRCQVRHWPENGRTDPVPCSPEHEAALRRLSPLAADRCPPRGLRLQLDLIAMPSDRHSLRFRLWLAGILRDAVEDGYVLAVFLREWLGLAPDKQRDGDRLLALTQLAAPNHRALLLAARKPLTYLRAAVRKEAARIATTVAEDGSRRWRRWLSFSEDLGPLVWNTSDRLAERRANGLDPATLHLRREELIVPRSGRSRPGLARLLAVAPNLTVTPREALLLRLLAAGVPPADAIRASESTRSEYSGLLHKARRHQAA